jgi:SAM-dependent methyltransferase
MSARNRKGNPDYAANANPYEYFETPAWATRSILHQLPKRCRYLDVGCGTGAIGSVVAHEGTPWGMVSGIEIDPVLAAKASEVGLCVETGDFLEMPVSEWQDTQVIISNPPYSLALEFLRKSLEIVIPNMGTVAMILRLPFLAAQLRAQFHKDHPSDIFVLPRRPSFTGKGTDATDYAWFVWGPGRGNRWSILPVPENFSDPRAAFFAARAEREENESVDIADLPDDDGEDSQETSDAGD